MKPCSNFIDSEWLLWLSRSKWVLSDIQVSMNSNAGVPTLGVQSIKDIAIPLPKIAEQRHISYKLDSFTERKKSETEKLNKLQKLKSGLMDDLLTGRVRVTALLDTAKAS